MINMKNKLKNKIKTLTMKQLIEIFETLTNKTEEELIVRDYIMDELEDRDAEAFDNWLDDETDGDLRKYFKIA